MGGVLNNSSFSTITGAASSASSAGDLAGLVTSSIANSNATLAAQQAMSANNNQVTMATAVQNEQNSLINGVAGAGQSQAKNISDLMKNQ